VPVQRRAKETRKGILEAARERFAQDGYDATGVAEICQAAGVSKGAFYHHFSSKQEVFVELLNQWLAEMDKQLALLNKAEGAVPDRLLAMTRLIQVVLRAAEDQLPIYLEFWTRAMRDPEVMKSVIQPFHRYQAFFAAMVREGVDEGSVGSVDPDIAARVLVSWALGTLIQGVFDPQGADWDRVSREGVSILLEGLNKR
jgi:AcrR family transcriptional regulator